MMMLVTSRQTTHSTRVLSRVGANSGHNIRNCLITPSPTPSRDSNNSIAVVSTDLRITGERDIHVTSSSSAVSVSINAACRWMRCVLVGVMCVGWCDVCWLV